MNVHIPEVSSESKNIEVFNNSLHFDSTSKNFEINTQIPTESHMEISSDRPTISDSENSSKEMVSPTEKIPLRETFRNWLINFSITRAAGN